MYVFMAQLIQQLHRKVLQSYSQSFFNTELFVSPFDYGCLCQSELWGRGSAEDTKSHTVSSVTGSLVSQSQPPAGLWVGDCVRAAGIM